jgi:hypothetical protein
MNAFYGLGIIVGALLSLALGFSEHFVLGGTLTNIFLGLAFEYLRRALQRRRDLRAVDGLFR